MDFVLANSQTHIQATSTILFLWLFDRPIHSSNQLIHGFCELNTTLQNNRRKKIVGMEK